MGAEVTSFSREFYPVNSETSAPLFLVFRFGDLRRVLRPVRGDSLSLLS